MSVTETQVIAAGTALEAAGEPVNGTALRRALGGHGRPEALVRVWQAHKLAQATRPAALEPLIDDALTALRQPLERLAEASWRGATDGLGARIRELEGQLRDAEEEMSATIDRSERALEEAHVQIDGLKAALAAAAEQHQTERRALQDKVRALEEQLATRDVERRTVRALADLLPSLQQAIADRAPSPDGSGDTEPTHRKRAPTNEQTAVLPLLDAMTASVGPLPIPTPA